MWKGTPQVGDTFYDQEGDTLLVVEINKDAGQEDEQVMLLCLDSGIADDYYWDSLDNFKCGVYLAKVA